MYIYITTMDSTMTDWPTEEDIPESLSDITGMGTFVTWTDDRFEQLKKEGLYRKTAKKPAICVLKRGFADRNGVSSPYALVWSPTLVPDGQKVWATSALTDYFERTASVTPFLMAIKATTTERGKQYFVINATPCDDKTLNSLPQQVKDLIEPLR